MSYLTKLLNPLQHCEDAAANLLKYLKLPFTRSYLKKALLEHPDYPSLLSISDVLGSDYNVANVALKMQREQILAEQGITAPFIIHIQNSKAGTVFAVVTAFSEDHIELYDPVAQKVKQLSPKDFDAIYRGTLLAVEAEENAGEKEYEQHRKEEERWRVMHYFLAFCLPVLTFLTCILVITSHQSDAVVSPVLFTVLTLSGCIVSTLLLWNEVDQYNPALKQICQAGKKVNCSAILNSKAATIFGLSWSSIGFTYFAGMLIVLLVAGLTNAPALLLLSWINIGALPYVLFSIYYQWQVAKQWCLLCLLVQGLLLLQFITALAGGFHTLLAFNQLSIITWLGVITAFGFAFTATQVLIPALQKAKEARQKTIELQRLKHNPQIFEALLGKQKVIEKPAADFGITTGNPTGRFKLIKVCNPYCGPCARAHPVMEALAESNGELCLQILFTATDDEKDIKKAPVSHLLAIAAQGDKVLTQKALDDWYNAPVKEYDTFAAKYPMNGALRQQDAKIKQMKEWCDTVSIGFTPTFFVCLDTRDPDAGFYQLPEMYTVADLNYFLTM